MKRHPLNFELSHIEYSIRPKSGLPFLLMNFDLSREWLCTNGIGGFASSTVIGCNTRRYHALLCAATRPPLGRMVLVNKADETLTLGDRSFELGCNQYPGAINPVGYQFLQDFAPSPLPTWTYKVPGATLRKTVWMPHGQNTTVVRYELIEGDAATLLARPFVTGRDYHGTHHYNTGFNTHCDSTEENGACIVSLQPYETCPQIVWSHDGTCPQIVWSHDGTWREGGAWYYNFEYSIEKERGLDFHEDAYCPGAWVWNLTREKPVATWVIGLEKHDPTEMLATYETEIARQNTLLETAQVSSTGNPPDDFKSRLIIAADQFIVQREDGLHTILAGYPWFSDWGRDTMIALPGLCLSTKRFDIARSILLAFAKASTQGMIPNRFPDAGETPDTNTVDATLWFFHAIERYVHASGDWDTLKNDLYPVLKDSIAWHIKGTRFNIKADERDGLLHAGDSSTQLTWMDAKVGDTVFTPRDGKPVEIQALWYNALRHMMAFAEVLGDEPTKKLCGDWSRRAKANFATTFWNEDAGCLYDYVSSDGSYKNADMRPNQIFAVSLPNRLLTLDQEKRVVQAVQRDLLTPVGLRSLSASDPKYRGIYIGDQWQRDSSYHQGTVWAWLIGGFLSAYLRVNRRSQASKARVREWLEPLHQHLDAACLNQISEIFDGNEPHTPRGCCAQAWSVAEPLRILLDEL